MIQPNPAHHADERASRLARVIGELDRQLGELDALGILPGAAELDLAIARLRSFGEDRPICEDRKLSAIAGAVRRGFS